MEERKGDWMLLHSGRQFYPQDPRKDEICIWDIAQGLSNTCRWGGHVKTFYSVAQHSVHVSEHVPNEMALEALLHDAPEAIVGDLTRPVKEAAGEAYARLEQGVHLAVCNAFGLNPAFDPHIKEIDYRICADERIALMPSLNKPPYFNLQEKDRIGVDIHPWEPRVAKARFLSRFSWLYSDRFGRNEYLKLEDQLRK